MRTTEQLIQAEEDFTVVWIEYQRALFTATTFALLLAVAAAVLMGAAFQQEMADRRASQINQENTRHG